MSVELKGVSLVINREPWLADVELALAAGQINVLIGPTRAGKTTLMRVIAGLDRPDTGKVIDNGQDVTGVSVRRRNLAMVYQQFINYPSQTVFENIASPLRIARKLSESEIEARVRDIATRLHIEPLLKRMPAELSGGQQQRTAIARALAKGANLLLLDEPLVNLDYKLREELRTELRELFADARTTVVYATTEPQEALTLGGRVVVMGEGRVLQHGPTLDVFHHPCSTRVAGIFSDPPMNLFPADVEAGARSARLIEGLRLPLGAHLAGLPAGALQLGLRPNHLRLEPRSAEDHVLSVEVELAEISGSDTFVHARWGGIGLVAQLPGVHRFAIGERVALHVNPDEFFAFDAAGALLAAPDRSVVARLSTRASA
ncbi:ABC transporter ATP-binding protein [Niveibacterium sp. SC-1]|uniref:ABC transporter ATP-binding protein n=1 Tax=Niveibacterium sp. SC-1 TaxID=3135646 RepID=UPI00311FB87F